MIIWSIALLSFLVTVDAYCGGITPGFVCKKDCCSQDEESKLLEVVKAKFYEKTTEEISDKLNHDHPNKIFFDLFYSDTPRYAIPANVEAAAKSGRFDSEVLVDYELIRKMGVTSFISDECKRTDFIGSFIRNTQLKMEKSHAIYRALVVADEIKKEILNFPLSEKCFDHALKNGLFNSHSCNSCGAGGMFPKMRTCTGLCENIVNGCYYVLTRVFARDYIPFKESLVSLLREHAREERALLRNEITMFLTETDIAEGVACSGQPAYEVEYRLQRLLAIPRHGRDRKLSSQFRMLLRSPEVIVPEFLPIQPNALNFCRNHGHLAGNSNCFNGNSVGFYSGETHPLNSSGQERNDFKTFGGNSEHYDKLATLLNKLTKVTEELQYQSSV